MPLSQSTSQPGLVFLLELQVSELEGCLHLLLRSFEVPSRDPSSSKNAFSHLDPLAPPPYPSPSSSTIVRASSSSLQNADYESCRIGAQGVGALMATTQLDDTWRVCCPPPPPLTQLLSLSLIIPDSRVFGVPSGRRWMTSLRT